MHGRVWAGQMGTTTFSKSTDSAQLQTDQPERKQDVAVSEWVK